jgi:hypothetical protein
MFDGVTESAGPRLWVELEGFRTLEHIPQRSSLATNYEHCRVVGKSVRACLAQAGVRWSYKLRCVARSNVGIKVKCPWASESSELVTVAADEEGGSVGWMRVVSVGKVGAVEQLRR